MLEDFHVNQNELISEAIAFLIDHAPPTLDLIITSRADPVLPLSRWRVRRQLNEIHSNDLRFTKEETAVLLQHMSLALSDIQTASLESRTEGWAGGLK